MRQKKCPHCGEYIQNSSLTCPKCFKEVPQEQFVERSEQEFGGDKKKGRRMLSDLAVLLAIFPPFIGLLGLGMMYLYPKSGKGYCFLAAGLLLSLSVLGLVFMSFRADSFLAAILFIALAIIALLVYISAAVAAFLETMFDSVFKVLDV
ncbi:MAG: hypothetical protein LBP82_02365 [Candidatus Methanoplasma sp.]|jgi:hypothetical protein|nr:hypothetical protein [Candidatus Methanoplasma sp.]